MRRHIVLVAGAVQAIAILAQPFPDKQKEITATVVNSVTGLPIANALVIFTPGVRVRLDGDPETTERPLRREPQRALTDGTGRSTFHELPLPASSLLVSHRGYRSETNSDVARVSLPPNTASVTVKLVPLGVFEGRVVNGDGEPLPGVSVEAVRVGVRDGLREFYPAASKTTDDLGRYRLWNLSPGSYYLKVVGRRGTMNALAATPQPSLSDEAYGPVYFPAAASQEGARVFRLGPGETASADFAVDGRPAYRIRGRLSSPIPNRRIVLRLVRGDDPMGNRASVNLSTGAFEVFDVTPGSYTLQAYTNDAADVLFGGVPVTVDKRDLNGIEVSLTSGVEVTGTIESPAEEDLLIQVSADHLGHQRLPAGVPSTIQAVRDGKSFTFPHLWPGCYELNFNARGSTYAASATSGTLDVLAGCLPVATSQPAPILVQLAKSAGEITGTVAGLEAGEHATIVAIRKARDVVHASLVYPGPDGSFSEYLAPGQYVLFAWREGQELEYRNPDALALFSAYGTPLSVDVSGKHQVALKLIPKEHN